MLLINFSKKRPVLVAMFLLFFSCTGIIVFLNKDFKLIDEKLLPTVAIEIDYPGMDAEKMEKTITTPVEEVISSISGINKIKSNTEAGKSHIDIGFNEFKSKLFDVNDSKDIEFKILELKERIDIVSKNFPKEVRKPRIYKFNPEQRPTLIFNFKSESMTLNAIREVLDKNLKAEIENINGVTQVLIAGGKVKEILVACDKQELEAYKISLREVVGTIANNNKTIGVGDMQKNFFTKNIYGSGKLNSITDVANLYIYSDKMTNSVKVSEISNVEYSFRDEDNSSRINTEETVGLYIYKSYNANTNFISENAKEVLLKTDLAGIKYTINFDEADEVKNNISNFSFIIFISLILVLFVLLQTIKNLAFILKLFFTIIIAFLIFFNFLIFFPSINIFILIGNLLGLVYFIHYLFYKNLSLYGIKCKVKKQSRYLKISKMKIDSKFIFLGFSFGLLCSISFFFENDNFRNLYQISFSFCFLYVILINTIQVIFPLVRLSLLNLNKKGIFQDKSLMRSYMLDVDLLKIKTPIKTIIKLLRGDFKAYPYFYVVGICALIASGFFFLLTMDKDSVYQVTKKQIFAFVEFPSGTGFAHTNEVTLKIESKLKPLMGVKKIISKVEAGHSLIVLDLENGTVADKDFLNYLKKSIGNINPAFLFFSAESTGGEFQEFTVDVLGNDLSILEKIVASQGEKVKPKYGVNEVILRYKQPRDELALHLDEYKMLNASLSYPEVGDFLKLAIQGGIATKLIQNQKEVDVRVRFAEKYRNSDRSLKEIRIKNRKNFFVPLSDISVGKASTVPMKIFHHNKRRTLSYSVRTVDLPRKDVQLLMNEILAYELPENYHLEIAELASNKNLNHIYMLLSYLFLSFFLISAYFESFQKAINIFLFSIILLTTQIVIQRVLYDNFTQIFYNSVQISLCTNLYLLIELDLSKRINFIYSFNLLLILLLIFLIFSIEIINLPFYLLFSQFICVALIFFTFPMFTKVMATITNQMTKRE